MKGIILAGGSATRLYPLTKAISKQILPVYDKPMIYYPLSILMLAGICEVLIISTKRDLSVFESLLGNGSQLGMSFSYISQSEPRGIAEAFLLGEEFIGGDKVCLILGDNIFYGASLTDILSDAASNDLATIFGYYVKDPCQYGVVEFDNNYKALSIEEKPANPKSHYAVPGLYFYDSGVVNLAKELKPSQRGELEITDLNKMFLKADKLTVIPIGRGIAWLDAGSPEGLLDASNYIASIQKRQGLYISCIEEIAYRKGFINEAQFCSLAESYGKTEYGEYLRTIAGTLD